MATNYTYSSELWLQGRPRVHVIRTLLSNIRTETICKPLTATSYYGVNGGFYHGASYDTTPERSSSICYHKADVGKTITVNGKTFNKNYNYNISASGSRIKKKTMVVYGTSTGLNAATFRYVDNKDTILSEFPNAEQIIGGTDYNLESWGEKAYYLPTQRTVLAWDSVAAYLIVTDIPTNIPGVKSNVEQLGLNPANSIILDGSGSTAMKCKEYTKKGDERHIFNMIRLKQTT